MPIISVAIILSCQERDCLGLRERHDVLAEAQSRVHCLSESRMPPIYTKLYNCDMHHQHDSASLTYLYNHFVRLLRAFDSKPLSLISRLQTEGLNLVSNLSFNLCIHSKSTYPTHSPCTSRSCCTNPLILHLPAPLYYPHNPSDKFCTQFPTL